MSLPAVGRKFIATFKSFNAVKTLNDYWRIKGLFLRMKLDPLLGSDDSIIEDIMTFLDSKTELPKHKFWSNLTVEQKMRACRVFVIKECSSADTDNTINFYSVTKKPDIFINLSGTVAVVSFV